MKLRDTVGHEAEEVFRPSNGDAQCDDHCGLGERLAVQYDGHDVLSGQVPLLELVKLRGAGLDEASPYIVDVTDDGGGPESELMGGTPVQGGTQLGRIRFVSPDGVAVGPTPGCTSSYLFNYYGSGGPGVDPACHPGATAVQSYRHSHYGKDRVGVTLDEEWFTTVGDAGSTLRAGIWYEDSRRDLGRDWHQMLDPTLNFNWNEQAYWHQYEWDFPQHIFKWYVEETLYAGPFALNGGIKQFLVGVSREDLFNVDPDLTVDSDSKLLVSSGVTYETPVEGLDLFAGYSETFRLYPDFPNGVSASYLCLSGGN